MDANPRRVLSTSSTLNTCKVAGSQLDAGRTQVLLQAMEFRGARDRHDPGPLRKQPGERDLRRRRILLTRDPMQQVNEGLVRCHRRRREARQHAAEIALGELGVLVHRPGQEPLAERAVWHEADAKLLARLQHPVGFRPARPQRVFVLDGGDGLHGMGAADGLRAGFGQAEMLDLALPDQVADGACHVLNRHGRVNAVLVEQVNHLDTKPLQGRLGHGADTLGAAVHAGLLAGRGINPEAELGGDHHPVPHRRQRLADHLLVGKGAVNLGGVEQGDAAFHRRADQRDALHLA